MRLRRLEQIANSMVEASVPTMILFCVKFAEMLIYTNGRRFGPVAFISARFAYGSACKSGTDEGYWAEMSAVYINQ